MVVVHAVDDRPDDQRDAGQNLVKYQPAMAADQNVTCDQDDGSADRAAPIVELVQHGLTEAAC